MKPVILIASCVPYALGREQEVARELWLQKSDLDYRFLLGDGTPTAEDEDALNEAWHSRHDRYKNNTDSNLATSYSPKFDELLFNLPDDYKHCGFKVREAYRWALGAGYTHAFVCCVDTYIDCHRLKDSGFDRGDYIGHSHGTSACGGKGYWLSERALEICYKVPVTTWAWDGWTGDALGLNGIALIHDGRYNAYPIIPRKNNEVITSHLNISPDVYDVSRAYEVAQQV